MPQNSLQNLCRKQIHHNPENLKLETWSWLFIYQIRSKTLVPTIHFRVNHSYPNFLLLKCEVIYVSYEWIDILLQGEGEVELWDTMVGWVIFLLVLDNSMFNWRTLKLFNLIPRPSCKLISRNHLVHKVW